MYSVHQHWDPLKTCIVGQAYPPEFYSYITNPKVRSVMERIAIETEEDFQSLIKLLESFGVTVLRPKLADSIDAYMFNGRYLLPPVCPRDYTAMIGDRFFIDSTHREAEFRDIIEHVRLQGNEVILDQGINTASIFRVGKDLYCGTTDFGDQEIWKVIKGKGWPKDMPSSWLGHIPQKFMQDKKVLAKHQELNKQHRDKIFKFFPEYRHHFYEQESHIDGCFCAVKPGLVVSLKEIQDYSQTFPGWEITYIEDQNWAGKREFWKIKSKNAGKWWVPGEEDNDEFIEFVESYLSHWLGYIEETVFDVNSLVIDEKNVICSNFHDNVLDAYQRHGITPHVITHRHRYFWDGGIHCITSDIHREGKQVDYGLLNSQGNRAH